MSQISISDSNASSGQMITSINPLNAPYNRPQIGIIDRVDDSHLVITSKQLQLADNTANPNDSPLPMLF